MRTSRNNNLKRVIVDFKKLNDNILNLLVTKFPNGYDRDDIITFRNAQNEIVECVEVKTEDTLYLVKVSKRLVSAMEDYEEEDEPGGEFDTDIPEESDLE